MKYSLLVLAVISVANAMAQTTTVRSQGSNTGNGRAYVAPVTTKTYVTPTTPNKTYTAPVKTYNYNSSPNSGSGSSGYNSPAPSPGVTPAGSGSSNTNPNANIPDYGIKWKTNTDKSIQEAIKQHDWQKAFVLYQELSYKFESRAEGGGKDRAGFLLVMELCAAALKDFSLMPLLYQAIYVHKMAYPYPLFLQLRPQDVHFDVNADVYTVNNACIYLGNYDKAIYNFRASTLYGRKKPILTKKKESYAGEYDKHEHARNYINYMSGRCFEALGQTDSARKYLGLGTGFEAVWDKLFTEGAAIRGSKKFYDPGK